MAPTNNISTTSPSSSFTRRSTNTPEKPIHYGWKSLFSFGGGSPNPENDPNKTEQQRQAALAKAEAKAKDQAAINASRDSIKAKQGGKEALSVIERSSKYDWGNENLPFAQVLKEINKKAEQSLYKLLDSFANPLSQDSKGNAINSDLIKAPIERSAHRLVDIGKSLKYFYEMEQAYQLKNQRENPKRFVGVPMTLDDAFKKLNELFEKSQKIPQPNKRNKFLDSALELIYQNKINSKGSIALNKIVSDVTSAFSQAIDKNQLVSIDALVQANTISLKQTKPEVPQAPVKVPENMPEALKANFEEFANSVQNDDKIKQLSKDIRELFAALDSDEVKKPELTAVIISLLKIELPAETNKRNLFISDFSTQLQNITKTVRKDNYSNEDYQKAVNDLKKLVLLLPTSTYSKSDDFSQAYEKFVKELNIENSSPMLGKTLFYFAQISKKANEKLTGSKDTQSKFFARTLDTLREKFHQYYKRLYVDVKDNQETKIEPLTKADEKAADRMMSKFLRGLNDTIWRLLQDSSATGLDIRDKVLSHLDSVFSKKAPVEQSAAA